MNATVQSRTVGRVTPYTPDPACLAAPFGKTVLEIPLNQGFPFHRVYFGRISTVGILYNERIRIGLRYEGRVVWEITTQESNVDVATVTAAPDTAGISTSQVFSPQYCVETTETSSASIPDITPRQMLSASNVMTFNCRIQLSLTRDLITRIYAAPLNVTQLADSAFLEVTHDNAITPPDLFWANRVYALGIHSTVTP
jgi:hypothetical protein